MQRTRLRRPQGLGAPPVPRIDPRMVPIFNPNGYGVPVPPQMRVSNFRIPSVTNPPRPPGYGPDPIPVHEQLKQLGRVIENEAWKDEEVIIPLNHWSRRLLVTDPDVDGIETFRSPLFDFWYDHIKEEGFPSGAYSQSAGGSTPAPGTAPTEAYQWQNHIFDYTLRVMGSSNTITSATLTLVGAMHLQAPDEPFTIASITATNDLAKSPYVYYMSGRVPMRFMQFQWSIAGVDSSAVAQIDVIQQMSVRKT